MKACHLLGSLCVVGGEGKLVAFAETFDFYKHKHTHIFMTSNINTQTYTQHISTYI